MHNKKDIKCGDRFGFLTVEHEVERFQQPSGQTQRGFLCVCQCGKKKKIRLSHLIHSRVTSCGCKIGESHKMAYSHMYRIWRSIKWRCDKRSEASKKYHGRGISVCKQWSDSFIAFRDWSLKNGYSRKLTIDRVNNDCGYSPENCRWVTQKVNNCNRRNTVYVKYGGEKVSLCLLLEELGRKKDTATISVRVRRGMSIQMALATPIKKGRYQR